MLVRHPHELSNFLVCATTGCQAGTCRRWLLVKGSSAPHHSADFLLVCCAVGHGPGPAALHAAPFDPTRLFISLFYIINICATIVVQHSIEGVTAHFESYIAA